MEKLKKMYVTAEEAAEMLGVSTGYAYKIIRGMNEELKSIGYRTICGKVPTKYFEGMLDGAKYLWQDGNEKAPTAATVRVVITGKPLLSIFAS